MFNFFLKNNFYRWGKKSNLDGLLIITENINATYFISFDHFYQNKHLGLNFFSIAEENFSKLSKFKIEKYVSKNKIKFIILSRAKLRSTLEKIITIKSSFPHTKLVDHIDDDLFSLPKSIGEIVYSRHMNEEVLSVRDELIQLSDLVYASTSELYQRLLKRFPSKNFFSGIYKEYSPFKTSYFHSIANSYTNKNIIKIGYTGSTSHQADLNMIASGLTSLLSSNNNLIFEIFGNIAIPDILMPFKNKIKLIKPMNNYEDYINKLRSLDWDYGIIPLANNTFNLCKAPTKLIEYIECGIFPLVSEISVYNVESIIKKISFKNSIEFKKRFYEFNSKSKRRELLNILDAVFKKKYPQNTLLSQLKSILD